MADTNSTRVNSNNVYRLEWTGTRADFAGRTVPTAQAIPIPQPNTLANSHQVIQGGANQVGAPTNEILPDGMDNVLDGVERSAGRAATDYPNAGSVLRMVGGIANGVGIVNDANNVLQHLVQQQYRGATMEAANAGGQVVGAWAGAEVGAAIGTAVWPGPGTVVVAGLGAIGGSVLGGSADEDQ